MSSSFESAIQDAVRDGYVVESQTGSSAVITKRANSPLWRTLLFALATAIGVACVFLSIFLIPIPLAMLYFWWKDSHEMIRIQIVLEDDGQVAHEPLPSK